VNLPATVGVALREAGCSTVVNAYRDLSGGCIHRVVLLTLEDGRSVVAKIAPPAQQFLLETEAASLKALAATNTVHLARPLGSVSDDESTILLLAALAPGLATDATWADFGRDLARLHDAEAGTRFGFEMDNYLGATPQPNGWMDDWVEFNGVHRLGFQVKRARDRGVISDDEASTFDRAIGRLEHLIPRHPKPALLHGDLWSGNALATIDSDGAPCIAVIDPATHVGDGWADIAMMKLFGGFSASCFAAYEEAIADTEQLETRIAVYQLYHVLNHANLFGRGYVGQALSLVDKVC